MEHSTGNIKVRKILDDVAVPKVFTLEIEAHDEGLVRLSAKTIVKLKVVNKETPIFDQLSYSRVVREDIKVGEEISRVQARSPGGAEIYYTITQGNPLNQFSIDLKSGEWLPALKVLYLKLEPNVTSRNSRVVIGQSELVPKTMWQLASAGKNGY